MGDNNVSVNVVIIGNEGHGKSSVGNFILKKKCFAVSRADMNPSRRQCYANGNHRNFTLKVVDMPAGPVVPQEQLQSYRQMIGEAFDRCEDKLHLFLLVIKFENENTGNCLQVFDNWRKILGPETFEKWGVIVMTFGDEFTRSMEENQTPDKTFINWCWDQGGSLRKLFEECEWRIVLVDDMADPEQKERTFEEFSNCMRRVDLPHPYSKTMFNEFTNYQQVLALQGESPDHTSGIQKELRSLKIELMLLQDDPNPTGLLDIGTRIDNLMKEQTKLTEDEKQTLSRWKREITDVKDKISKTNRALIKSTAGRTLAAAPPSGSRLGLVEVLKEHSVAIAIIAIAMLIVGVCVYKKRKIGLPGNTRMTG